MTTTARQHNHYRHHAERPLRGCWLLSDLDGTLLPTPHKAHGEYVPLSQSPCFAPIKRWLQLGGSLCVVTTADRRVVDQVYAPLRPLLNSSNGALLLSVYTGALLYQTSENGILEEPQYRARCGVPRVQTETRFSEKHGSEERIVRTTCMSPELTDKLSALVIKVYLQFARDVILKSSPKVTHAVEHQLSQRYRTMWSNILRLLDAKYRRYHVGGAATSSGVTDELQWKVRYLDDHPSLLLQVGIVRREEIKDLSANSTLRPIEGTLEGLQEVERERTSLHVKKLEHTKLKQIFQQQAELTTEATQEVSMNGEPSALGAELNSFVKETQQLLGYEGPPNLLSVPQRKTVSRPDVAQLIVVGIPMSLYDHYFLPHQSDFDALGVSSIPQPNSVVFSLRGVGKHSTVEYLADQSLTQPNSFSSPSFQGVVDLRKAVALGDNPHTADYDLSIFNSLQFVSVEVGKQRMQRHKKIDELETSAATSQRRPLSVALTRGSFMDDRRISHLTHIGGEEFGSAAFIDALTSTLVSYREGEHEASTEEIPQEVFQRAIGEAAVASRCVVARNESLNTTPNPFSSSHL